MIMARNERTSQRVGKLAAKALSGKTLTAAEQKSLAASALTQVAPKVEKPASRKGWAVKLSDGTLMRDMFSDEQKNRAGQRYLRHWFNPGAKFVRVVLTEVTNIPKGETPMAKKAKKAAAKKPAKPKKAK
jgi:hypothetical protein